MTNHPNQNPLVEEIVRNFHLEGKISTQHAEDIKEVLANALLRVQEETGKKVRKSIMAQINTAGGIGGMRHLGEIIDKALSTPKPPQDDE